MLVEMDESLESRCAELLAQWSPHSTAVHEFLRQQFDAGLAWVDFPERAGGLGFPKRFRLFVENRLRESGAPSGYARNPIGYGMAAPTILAHGNGEQVARYLRRLFSCEDIWCQMFSEPGAGSDVASLTTHAVRDGDEWVVNGQKVWTTLAHTARYGMLLARTDPEAEKHKGLTFFVADMHAPGVEVRPLRQLTGDAEFNEVFFTDVRIPDSDRLGPEGQGWSIALTTLMNERVSIGSVTGPRGAGHIATAMELWQQRGGTGVQRDRLLSLWIDTEVQRLTSVRAAENALRGTPGPEGSTVKLAGAENNKRVFEFCVDLLGPQGLLYSSYEMRRPEALSEGEPIQKSFLRSRANSIEGGTSEIMRNILAERVLGLPGDVRVDKGRPWSAVPRG